jgi:hypothetical protein
MTLADWLSTLGAVGFGAIIGWYVYYINRYRNSDVQFSDLTTVIAIIGGGVVIQLFNTPNLFGAYGIGLFLGFFGYFVSLLLLIKSSDNFTADFLLDGRRRVLEGTGFYIPGDFVRPAMFPQLPVQPGAQSDLAALRAQATLPSSLDPATVAASALSEETRQARGSAEELRQATLEAQRTLGALTQATQSAAPRPAAPANPAAAKGR